MITRTQFGILPDGQPVDLFTLTNDSGTSVKITNYGGIIISLLVPDRHGQLGDVTLGYETFEGYLANTPYFGCITGRYANRIAEGRFVLDGVTYQLEVNHPPNHLHGGRVGFNKRLWRPYPWTDAQGEHLALSYFSPDGEEGYPGDLFVTVIYTLSTDNALRIRYHAQSSAPTILNLTNHAYFNLAGTGDVLNHEVQINSDTFAVSDETLIPTGELRSVEGTPLDFRQPKRIGDRIDAPDTQLRNGRGYDHSYILPGATGELRFAARVHEPTSGRTLEVFTTEPTVHLYTGNNLDGTIIGKGGVVYAPRAGLCLETQHLPNSPNQPEFPSTVLRPGEHFYSETVYRFK
ncbi:MAG: aldose epimerase family protein [Anaerolineae bacterium]|nr:galactose mutarotase [Thermoflexales bacterium]MDW8395407.1 aldose epimerase family protein [Anaerolineae bacterium]